MSTTTTPSEPQQEQQIIQTEITQDPLHFEQEFVTNVYNHIAPHFSSTRYKAWPYVEQFLLNKAQLSKYSFVADVGCGNGKYMGVNNDLIMFGSDISEGLLNICSERGFESLVASNERLPYRDDSFDAVISVAVVHHFSTDERRLWAIQELYRICKPGGKVLIYVWAFEQIDKKTGKQRFNEQDVFIKWHLQKQFDRTKRKTQKSSQVEANSSSSDSSDNKNNSEESRNFDYDKERDEKVYKRYYHLFKKGELEHLVQSCSTLDHIVDVHYEADNWIVVGQKK